MVVIDELSSFKSHRAKRFKALKRVRPKVRRIVGLTGTPAPNGLIDLWAEIGLLDMGLFLPRFILKLINFTLALSPTSIPFTLLVVDMGIFIQLAVQRKTGEI